MEKPRSGNIYSIVTRHVGTVVLLRREKVDVYIEADVDVEKLTGRAGTASYGEIKAYVEEKAWIEGYKPLHRADKG